MITLTGLWLAILVSAVFVFIVSSILHMVLPIHKNDFKKIPGEESVLAEMRKHNIQPGSYMFPCPDSMKEMGTPEMIEKYKQGPVGNMNVLPNGPPAMGKSLLQWFLFSILLSVFVAYLATMGLYNDTACMDVFRFTSTAAILGYAIAGIPESIWKGVGWGITLKFMFDGVVYGLVTGSIFAWLWPVGV